MIMLRMHPLEAEHDPLHESGDFGKTLKWWGRYLDYANTVCLLLDSASLEITSTSIMETRYA
jgi:hypothetical protein